MPVGLSTRTFEEGEKECESPGPTGDPATLTLTPGSNEASGRLSGSTVPLERPRLSWLLEDTPPSSLPKSFSRLDTPPRECPGGGVAELQCLPTL